MLSCLVRCVKMAAKFDEFSISENMAMLTVMRKFKNNTRSRIGHDHKVCFTQSPEGFWFDFKARHPLNFWTTLKSLSNQVESSLDSTVPMCKLYNHFHKLHSEPNANLLKKQELILKELKYKKNNTITA